MKIKLKRSARVFVLTLTADEAKALYLAIDPGTAASLAENGNKAKYEKYAQEIEFALSDSLYNG